MEWDGGEGPVLQEGRGTMEEAVRREGEVEEEGVLQHQFTQCG